MITVQQIHVAMKSAGYSCALRFPTAAGLPDAPMAGYRITRKVWGWEITQRAATGSRVKATPDYLLTITAAGMTARCVRGAIWIEV